ncbi:MAG: septum formation initiator family protein [Clostridia bacterium]
MEPNIYEFSTSPRKLEPELNPKRHKQRKKLKVVEDLPRQEIKISKAQKRRQAKLTLTVIAIFALLLTISYRNSQINEKFTQVQSQKKELASLQKENEQLKVNIANGLNLNNIEKLAKEKLGMQKLTNKQTLYVSLPKKDYVESASEKVVIEKEQNWFENFVNKIFSK